MRDVPRTDDSSASGETLDLLAISELMFAAILDRYIDGEIVPDFTELKTILEIQTRLGGAGDVDREGYLDAMSIHFEIMHEIIPPEFLGEYGTRIARVPVLNGAMVRHEVQQRKARERMRAEIIAELGLAGASLPGPGPADARGTGG